MRNRNQIVRLVPEDWSVHWKFGGVDSDFELTDPNWNGFQMQHDVHDLGDGNILLLTTPLSIKMGFLSRALGNSTGHNRVFGRKSLAICTSRGSLRPISRKPIRLENGNTLIGWGTA